MRGYSRRASTSVAGYGSDRLNLLSFTGIIFTRRMIEVAAELQVKPETQ